MLRWLTPWRVADPPPDAGGGSRPVSSLVMSLAPAIREGIRNCVPEVTSTREAFERLFRLARQELRIFAPYCDAAVTGLLQDIDISMRIVTTSKDKKRNPVLERLATAKPLMKVKYVHQEKEGALLHQMHAKLVLADCALAYVGSANFNDASLHYNLELGLLVDDPPILKALVKIFNHVFTQVARDNP